MMAAWREAEANCLHQKLQVSGTSYVLLGKGHDPSAAAAAATYDLT
jgi:hypothetical protein